MIRYTLNLVAVSAESTQEPFLEVVDDISLRLAARTFILRVDPRAEPWALDGEVGAVCRYVSGRKGEEVCAERIELSLGAMTSRRARSIIESLSESRLPSVLYLGQGAHAAVVDGLAPDCSRVVFDSAHHGVARSERIAGLASGHIEDLAFSRDRRWREMIARFFDDPALLPAVRRIRSVRIEHVSCAREEGPERRRICCSAGSADDSVGGRPAALSRTTRTTSKSSSSSTSTTTSRSAGSSR